jgi:hypothetical protein
MVKEDNGFYSEEELEKEEILIEEADEINYMWNKKEERRLEELFDVSYVIGENADSDGGTLYDGEEIGDMYASKKQAQREIERRKKR